MDRRAGSLFAGVGGLDQAAAEVFGAELAWVSDNDPAASVVLAHRYPNAPNLGDITAIDWSTVEPVWLLTAGWPCQPWSTAGKRRGVEDERALWPEVARAIRDLRPRVVVLENVPAIIGAGELARACGDLAACGYQFGWVVLGADEVGAPHRRRRCFVLAVADTDSERPVRAGSTRGRWSGPAGHDLPAADPAGDGRHEGRSEPAWEQWGPDAALGGGEAPADTPSARQTPVLTGAALGGPGGAADRGGAVQFGGLRRAVADSDGAGLQGAEPAPGHLVPAGSASPDADGDRREVVERSESGVGPRDDIDGCGPLDWGVYTAAVRRWERVLGRPAPVPRVAGPRGGLKLNPALPEWMQGFPAGWITAVPGVSLNDALKLAGNSVNPFQAAAALRWLAAQLPTPVTPGGTQ